ncbi:MAG: STAS domain-containing protein [SAR324 cluster bacterium]|nr:STAS domain-containing protein [SAR324 cluster bacterium]
MWSKKKYEVVRLELANLNMQDAGYFREYLDSILAEENHHIIIDFSSLQSIGSIGMGVIFSILKKIKERNGDLQIIGVNQKVLELLKVAKLDKMIPIYSVE